MKLLAKPIKEKLKYLISINRDKIKHPFYLYSDKENIDSFYYLKGIKRVLDEFSIAYEEGFLDKKNVSQSLKEFEAKAIDHFTILARPLNVENESEFIQKINHNLDPDRMSDINLGRLLQGDLTYLPATIQSVKAFIDFYNLQVSSKKALIIGRSLTVGLPLALLLNKYNSTITIAHSKTPIEQLRESIRNADILALASGNDTLVSQDLLHDNQLIIDCGYHDGHGDLCFEPNETVLYTPVPNGIGALTSYCLILNAIEQS